MTHLLSRFLNHFQTILHCLLACTLKLGLEFTVHVIVDNTIVGPGK